MRPARCLNLGLSRKKTKWNTILNSTLFFGKRKQGHIPQRCFLGNVSKATFPLDASLFLSLLLANTLTCRYQKGMIGPKPETKVALKSKNPPKQDLPKRHLLGAAASVIPTGEPAPFHIGMKVDARWRKKKQYYPATVMHVERTATA
jgi:hypothetical protein